MADTYRIIKGGRVTSTTFAENGVDGVPIMVPYGTSPMGSTAYEVISDFSKTPLGAVTYVNDVYLSEESDGGIGAESEIKTTPKTVTIPITNQFNDYDYETTVSMLDEIFEFRAYVELIFSIAYDYCELVKDESVSGVELSGDSTGFLFKSKYFTSANKFDNYRTLLGLVNERFNSLKRQYFMWNYSQVRINSISPSSYNFFIFPS